jgi:hypothetical protein
MRQSVQETKAALDNLLNATSAASGPIVKALQALEKAKTTIKQGLSTIDLSAGNKSATVADIGESARKALSANQALVAALRNNSPDDVAAAAAHEAEATCELLQNCKGASAPHQAQQGEVMASAKGASNSSVALLDAAKSYQADDPETHARLAAAFDDHQEKIQAVVGAARKLPDGALLDMNDDYLSQQVEQALTAAIQEIEAASGRIARPPESSDTRQQIIHEGIIDAAKAITKASGALMGAAGAAQKELLVKTKSNKLANPYNKDPAWAQGLIATVQHVAHNTAALVNSANDVVAKRANEEQLIVTARYVFLLWLVFVALPTVGDALCNCQREFRRSLKILL